MADMERENAKTQGTIADINEAHNKRMDGLQAEILDLQNKVSESAPVSPTSPGMPRDYRTVPPVEEVFFDLVVGGWKAGRSRESVSEQLNMDAGAANEANRNFQINTREAIRAVLPDDWWVTLDKPPYMRKICKSVASLSHFLESRNLVLRRRIWWLDLGSELARFLGSVRLPERPQVRVMFLSMRKSS